MSLEYEIASKVRPVLGTAAVATMDGTVFTPWIDTDTYDGHSLIAIANLSAVATYAAATWIWQESDDNGSTSNVVDAEKIITPLPTPTSGTSKVFHSGCVSKKRYVRCSFGAGGAQTGQVTILISNLDTNPVFHAG
jgi:hypothetical protein